MLKNSAAEYICENHDVFQNSLWKRKFKRTVFIQNIILLYHCKCLYCHLIDKLDAYLQKWSSKRKSILENSQTRRQSNVKKKGVSITVVYTYLSADLFSPWYFISSILSLDSFFLLCFPVLAHSSVTHASPGTSTAVGSHVKYLCHLCVCVCVCVCQAHCLSLGCAYA